MSMSESWVGSTPSQQEIHIHLTNYFKPERSQNISKKDTKFVSWTKASLKENGSKQDARVYSNIAVFKQIKCCMGGPFFCLIVFLKKVVFIVE